MLEYNRIGFKKKRKPLRSPHYDILSALGKCLLCLYVNPCPFVRMLHLLQTGAVVVIRMGHVRRDGADVDVSGGVHHFRFRVFVIRDV